MRNSHIINNSNNPILQKVESKLAQKFTKKLDKIDADSSSKLYKSSKNFDKVKLQAKLENSEVNKVKLLQKKYTIASDHNKLKEGNVKRENAIDNIRAQILPSDNDGEKIEKMKEIIGANKNNFSFDSDVFYILSKESFINDNNHYVVWQDSQNVLKKSRVKDLNPEQLKEIFQENSFYKMQIENHGNKNNQELNSSLAEEAMLQKGVCNFNEIDEENKDFVAKKLLDFVETGHQIITDFAKNEEYNLDNSSTSIKEKLKTYEEDIKIMRKQIDLIESNANEEVMYKATKKSDQFFAKQMADSAYGFEKEAMYANFKKSRGQ